MQRNPLRSHKLALSIQGVDRSELSSWSRCHKKEFKEIDGTIVYTNPNYKVWVGNFETRIEVEKAMLEIKKKYPTALIIKPSK